MRMHLWMNFIQRTIDSQEKEKNVKIYVQSQWRVVLLWYHIFWQSSIQRGRHTQLCIITSLKWIIQICSNFYCWVCKIAFYSPNPHCCLSTNSLTLEILLNNYFLNTNLMIIISSLQQCKTILNGPYQSMVYRSVLQRPPHATIHFMCNHQLFIWIKTEHTFSMVNELKMFAHIYFRYTVCECIQIE